MASHPNVRAGEDQLFRLVSTALDQDELCGLSEMLKSIALAVDAYGCILWQVTPATGPYEEHLFVLADWFSDGRSCTLYNLPLGSSLTGLVVRTQESQSALNVATDERVFHDPFLSEAGIQAFCSAPIQFLDDAQGAINLYRNTPRPFSKGEIAQAERLANLVPRLYRTIRDRVSFNLITKVNKILHEADLRASTRTIGVLDKPAVKTVLKRLCEQVSASFQCIETSIFLEDRLEKPDVFELMATTWPKSLLFKKTSYRRSVKEGATGWVLQKVKPVTLFDLARFDKKAAGRQYPSLEWKDSLDIRATARSILLKKEEEALPPLSFMAVPIRLGKVVYGAMRCSVARRGPFYFARRELDLLELVAAQLGRFWSNWLNRRELQQKLQSLEALVESIGELNSFVHTELTKPSPDEQRILREALRMTSNVIQGADIIDVRLLDEKGKELYFAATHGRKWDEARRQLRFPVEDDSRASAGAHVIRTGEVYVVKDVQKDPHYRVTFPDTRRLIVAPLSVEIKGDEKPQGVLDIRSTNDRDFPGYAVLIAELLGRQLALYRFLATAIRNLRASVEELKRLQELQVQMFEDMNHQFKTPIVQAHARVQALLRSVGEAGDLKHQTLAIRGLCAKAKRVSMNSGLFASLARREPIQVTKSLWKGDDFVKLLIEAAQDNSLMISSRRQISFHVDARSFENVRPVGVDKNLLEQAVTNVLDNAFKYSYSQKQVVISGGYTKTGRFFISIVNEGIPILPGEPQQCVLRGWQSEQAKLVSETGSGIGLWIVHNILQAHGGELIIEPTRDRKTEVRLVFITE